MSQNSRPDFATLGGLLLACGGILGGLLLEGGSLHDIAQVTAGMIVLGGTLGAAMVSTPMPVLLGALRRLRQVVFQGTTGSAAVVEEIIGYAAKARKGGLVSLETEAAQASDPFLRKALTLAVDGCDIQELRTMMELEIELSEARAHAEVQVFEAAGGYAPTIGIIGAVLGLIQVMKKLADTEQVGHGIATAFVATVYGVAIANLLFLPAANKIKARINEETQLRELILEGVCAIVEGLNPKLVRSKLEAYVPTAKPATSAPVASRQKAA